MKAAVIDRYGSPYSFKIREMPEPDLKENEILVKVKASSVNPVDWKIRQGKLKVVTGTGFPKILGADFSGDVVETGAGIKDYKKGDAVFGLIPAVKGGAYAEYLQVKPENLALKPANIGYEEAAGIPLAGLTALQGLRDYGHLKPGQKVLINGASGGVGSFAVQIAKAMGATVSGVCSTSNQEFVKKLGAEKVIDYSQEDVLDEQQKYHLIFDAHGNLLFSKAKKSLYDEGLLVTTLPSPKSLLDIVVSQFSRHKGMKTFFLTHSHNDLDELKRLVEKEALHPQIDKVYTLEELPEAHEYSEGGHVSGKIIIKL